MPSTHQSINLPSEHLSCANISPLIHSGQVSADTDSAEDIDSDTPMDEEEDEDEVLVEEDQMQTTVCIFDQTMLEWISGGDQTANLECYFCVNSQEGDDDADEDSENVEKSVMSHPDVDTTILFTTGEGWSGSS